MQRMARQVVALAFLLLAVVQAFAVATAAAASTPSPVDSSDNSDADFAEPPTDGVIGVLEAADSPDSVVAAPMGGPVPPGAFDSAGSGSSDASTIQFSAAAGAAALAASVLYF